MRIKKGTTRLEAAQEWINGFNAVPTLMIAKLWTADPDDWCEITRPAVGDQVRVFNNICGVLCGHSAIFVITTGLTMKSTSS